MKVNFEKINSQKNNVNFEGYKPVKSMFGEKLYEFNYPFDSENFDCYLEVYQVDVDEKGNYFVTDELLANKKDKNGYYKLNPNRNVVDLRDNFGLVKDDAFAYHYALVPKGTDRTAKNSTPPFYRIDAGDYIDATSAKDAYSIYNIVTQKGSLSTKSGAMKLIMPDFYNAMWTYDEKGDIVKNKNYDNITKSVKNFSNKLGGNLAGLQKDVELGKFDGYSRIVSTPIFTNDSLTPHAYWNTNCMQMAQSLGNINNYASLQRAMFSKGLNFVSDGAFVNEGLQGVHFKHVLKWGEQSPYWNWFRINEGGPVGLGVFGKRHEFVSHKLVNAPYAFSQDENGKISWQKLPQLKKGSKPQSGSQYYDPSKPTYIQIYDNRLVSDKQKKDNAHLIESYEKLSTDNLLEINTFNDTVIPYSFEIEPETYKRNIEVLNDLNKSKKTSDKIKLDSYLGTKLVSKFEKFTLEDIPDGVDLWDANKDIVKLNYVTSDSSVMQVKQTYDPKKHAQRYEYLDKINYQVRDYAISSGQYWTKKTNEILTQYVAQKLRGVDTDSPKLVYERIQSNIKDGSFPRQMNAKISKNIINNVLNDDYDLNGAAIQEEYSSLLLRNLMDLPLDTIEFGDNLTGVLASPYITKRATDEKSLGVSRYELYKKKNPHLLAEYEKTYKKMDNIYKEEIYKASKEILDNINNMAQEESKIYNSPNATSFGKYVLPQLTQEIVKFLVVKALSPDTKVSINAKTGEITYDYKNLNQVSIESLGIIATNPQDEANQVLNKLRDGIKNIKAEDKKEISQALLKSIAGTNEQSYRLAEMIVDRMDAGLDWRIDAAKDIADINDLKNGGTNVDRAWQQVTDFWKAFTENVHQENRNSYVVAEVTNEKDLHELGGGEGAKKYSSPSEMVKKMIRETGMTSVANYGYFYSSIINMFGKSYEGIDQMNADPFNNDISHRMNDKSQNFFKSLPLEGLTYSYNFIGNHDKPRTLHAFMLDSNFFQCDLTDSNNVEYRKRAYKVVKDKFIGKIVEKYPDEDENSYNNRVNAVVSTFDFTTVNPKSVAMAEALQAALAKAIEEKFPASKNEKLHNEAVTAIFKSISDLARGKFKDGNVTADAFGVKPADVAIDLILEHANYKYSLGNTLNSFEQKELKDKAFENALKPALKKLQATMEYLNATVGMPTLYAGDDTGATGYETATKNIYLQNRSLIRQDWLDSTNKNYKPFIKEHYDKVNKIMSMRSRPELRALNNGAPFNLPIQKGVTNGAAIDVSAILRQNTDGAMTISLFNTTGLNYAHEEDYNPQYVDLESIVLKNSDTSRDFPASNVTGLKPGTIFRNAKDPNDTYIVREFNGSNFLKHRVENEDGTYRDEKIYFNDPTLILYAVPQQRKVLYNKVYNTISKPRRDAIRAKVGAKLSVESK